MTFYILLHIAISKLIMKNSILKPQDVVILLKITSSSQIGWRQVDLAHSLNMSQSEISHSIKRCQYNGFLNETGKKLRAYAFFDFLRYGIKYVFPQKPGALQRGIPTAHSAPPLQDKINGEDIYIWPSPTGKVRGQTILPLYPTVPESVSDDKLFYELLALVDVLRVGKAREQELAIPELEKRLMIA